MEETAEGRRGPPRAVAPLEEEKVNFLDKFSKKNIQISNFVKIRQVGTELFHADGRTDMTKPIVAFRNFANSPKNTDAPLLPASTPRT